MSIEVRMCHGAALSKGAFHLLAIALGNMGAAVTKAVSAFEYFAPIADIAIRFMLYEDKALRQARAFRRACKVGNSEL